MSDVPAAPPGDGVPGVPGVPGGHGDPDRPEGGTRSGDGVPATAGAAPPPVAAATAGAAPPPVAAATAGAAPPSAEDAPEPVDVGGELDTLAAELRRVLALADPVPDDWRAAAIASHAWVAIDAPAAVLVFDSRAVQGGRVGTATQGTGAALREIRFGAGPLVVEVEVDAGADKLRVFGRVHPARAVEVVALWPEGRLATTSDGDGTYRFDELPRRPLCLHVVGEPAVKTGWIVA
jgi:hypothetical protein